jgi:hypothetical protein
VVPVISYPCAHLPLAFCSRIFAFSSFRPGDKLPEFFDLSHEVRRLCMTRNGNCAPGWPMTA